MSDYRDSRHPDDEDKTLGEQIGESIRSEDEPLEDKKPSAPLALVMGSYPIILTLLLLALAAYFFWFRGGGEQADVDDNPAQPAEVQTLDQPATTPAG